MPHFRVDDALHSHPKGAKAGDEALGMWVRAGTFCMAYLTDGFVPERWVKQQPKGMAKAQRLVAAGLWHPSVRDDERGWNFHEWRQDSKQQIEADRENARRRKVKSRRKSQGESRRDMPVTDAVSHGVSHAERPGIPITHTQYPTSGYVQSGPYESNARARPRTFTEIATGEPEPVPDPPPPDTAGQGIAATPAAELVNAAVTTSRYAARTLRDLRKHVTTLLDDHTDPQLIAETLRIWDERPDAGPGLLPSLLAEAAKTLRPIPNRARKPPSKGDEKVNGWLHMDVGNHTECRKEITP